MNVTIKVRPSGLYAGQEWPQVGESIDLPDHVAEGMIGAGLVAPAKADEPAAEKRPASTDGIELRAAKKTTAKKAE